jgi:hypothetical protein
MPAMRYSGSDSTSSATNISSRLFAIGKIIIPETANSSSGNTSVCTRVLRDRVRSVGEPTTTAADATIGLPTSTLRSDTSSVAIRASTRIVPCRNRPTPSTPSVPANAGSLPTGLGVAVRVLCSTPTLTSAATRPPSVTNICTLNRSRRGTTASTITPTSAAPSTMKIGNSAWYATDGVSIGVLMAARSMVISPLRRPARIAGSGRSAGRFAMCPSRPD